MKPTLFRCPVTGKLVQHFIAEIATDTQGYDRFESVKCLACGLSHMINVTTGKVLGQRD